MIGVPQFVDRVPARCHGDDRRPDRPAALDVERRISDDPEFAAVDIPLHVKPHRLHGTAGHIVPFVVVVPVTTAGEVVPEAEVRQFDACPGQCVAGEQPELDVVPFGKFVQNRWNPGADGAAEFGETSGKCRQVSGLKRLKIRFRFVQSIRTKQVEADASVGTAGVGDFVPHFVDGEGGFQPTFHGKFAGTAAADERAVDIEKQHRHDLVDSVQVSVASNRGYGYVADPRHKLSIVIRKEADTMRTFSQWISPRGLALSIGMAGTAGLAATAYTQQPAAPQPAAAAVVMPGHEEDYNRPVAYVHGNVPITRRDLGEFLMARGGADKIDLLVNKIIIETEGKRLGITVTEKEMEAAFLSDLAGLDVKKGDFVKMVLPKYGKTLFEWMEDVIRPRLLLTKMVAATIQVSDAEIQIQFDREYGEKRQVQIILWPKGDDLKAIQNEYAKIRTSQQEFDRVARAMANPALAATAGMIKPISRNTTGSDKIVETMAYQLQPGEISQILETSQGYLVMKLHVVIPPDAKVNAAQVKDRLTKQAFEERLSMEIPKHFETLKKAAKPKTIYDGPATWKYGGDAADATNELVRPVGGVAPSSPPVPKQ